MLRGQVVGQGAAGGGPDRGELKPKVLETFDAIADTFKRLRRLQDQDIHNKLHNESLSPAQERKYKKLKKEIIVEMKSLRLNQARIDALVEQLYDINKRLVGHEGRLMRLAEGHGVTRDDFLENYQGAELDPHWLDHVSKLSARGWNTFVARDADRIKELRGGIHALATETGLEIGEFRKIVHMVQKGEREARQAKKEMVEANLRLVIEHNFPLFCEFSVRERSARLHVGHTKHYAQRQAVSRRGEPPSKPTNKQNSADLVLTIGAREPPNNLLLGDGLQRFGIVKLRGGVCYPAADQTVTIDAR